MAKGRMFLIHWNQGEAEAYASAMRAKGWKVAFEAEDGERGYKAIQADPPDVVVIYHTRLPSHGRATAEYLAQAKATRDIPILFVGGEGGALDKTKAKVPGARFISEDELDKALARYVKIA